MSDLFQGGPDAHSMDLGFGPDPQPRQPDNQGPAAGGGQVVLTQEQFTELLNRVMTQHQTNDYAAAIQGAPEPEPLPEIDLSMLPNPQTDPDGFKGALGQILTGAREQIVSETRQEINQAQQTNDLLNDAWALMRERYPELDESDDTRNLVIMAREREAADLANRGLDWRSALSANMEGAVETVAQRAMASLNRLRGFQGDGDGDTSRTEMIGGGNPRPGPKPQREQPSNLVDEIKSEQKRLGIY